MSRFLLNVPADDVRKLDEITKRGGFAGSLVQLNKANYA